MPAAVGNASAAAHVRKLRRLETKNRALERARAALMAVQEASAAVASQLDPSQALQDIVDRALEVVRGDSATIFIVTPDGKHLESRAIAGDSPHSSDPLPRVRTSSHGWRALCERGGFVIHDADNDPYLRRDRRQVRDRHVKSMLAAPLIARGKVIGLVAVVNRHRKRAFSESDLQLLRLFANQAAVALDNSRLCAQATEYSAQARSQVELVKTVLDGIRDPLVLLDEHDRVTYGNRALFSVLGRKPDDVLGRKWHEYVDPEDVDALLVQHEADGHDAIITRELQLVRPDNTRTPVLLRSGYASSADGRHLGMMAAMVDYADRQRFERTLRRRGTMLAAIGRLTRAVGKTHDLHGLAQQALDSCLRLTGLKCGAILLTQENDCLLAAERGLTAAGFPISGSLSALALESDRPLVYADIRRSRRLDPEFRKWFSADDCSAASVPIPGREGPIGVVWLRAHDPRPFTHEAMTTLSILAAQFGAAAENMRLYQAARMRADRLAVLNEAADQLVTCSGMEAVVPVMCRAMAQILRARRVLCLHYKRDQKVLVPLGGYKVSAARLRRLAPARLSQAPLVALAVKERQAVLSEDARRQRALPEDYRQILGLGSVVAVPVISRRELWGTILAGNGERTIGLSPDDNEMAMALANHCAITLDNSHLLREERERSRQLSLAMQEAHHRIKNNLQAVCDVLELELMDGRGVGATNIENSIQRVRAIAMVHELLSRHSDVATVEVAQVLARLVPLVVASSQRGDQQVRSTLRACPLRLDAKRTTAVVLVVNELVSNAVQHGLNHGRGGLVKVDMAERDGSVALRVADDGSGLPQGFSPRTHAHVGLDIARVLAERDLGGTISLQRRRGRGGTIASVRFPK